MSNEIQNPGVSGGRTASPRMPPFTLVMLGSYAVGKSSLVFRFAKNWFNPNVESTLGAAFVRKTVTLDNLAVVKLHIWDTAGQERFKAVAPFYFRRAQAALVVYDITNQGTFVRAKEWVETLRQQAPADLIIALSGNKSDLGNHRAVSHEEASAYAEENGLLFMETSARNPDNVDDIFLAVARQLSMRDADADLGDAPSEGTRISEDTSNTLERYAASCCKQ